MLTFRCLFLYKDNRTVQNKTKESMMYVAFSRLMLCVKSRNNTTLKPIPHITV